MRKGEHIFNYALMLGPLAIGLGVVWAMGLGHSMPRTSLWAMTVLFLAGFAMFVKAKCSVIKQGQLLTFGPAQMSKQNRILYFTGYTGMGLGLFLLLGFVLVGR